ncbi:NAD-dependent epimerase/dehydratase family protein [Aneurinibacillus migulanus]|uniref:Epimerase n=2 Tax=Aneurinibacillus migulanus TaxID=47500 RepID=A0A0D1YE58_ANEMI|nr:NAD(P)-dependent oxidoreductase [Aneurinibacillus migulanus]KIV57262.1 epimerase [Aneurinibacillus migulanus]KON96843.1 epimerase [Aneurinibacillus migulanus]MED0895204.1 NAD(P)-dependent oxidoreductase [Aneurinibacillus migulanus]MED1619476.1 NAD(P)-dependent oxidoreductase [Aneurinibacillus migulanus]SDJ58161.1 NAD dependent epimerase/dehydratase family protein [Aneurinibacillus migulanus]
MKTIVFGGTGFIGGHVVEQLHLNGHQVTAAVRDTSNTTFLESLGIHVVNVDFSDSTALRKVIEGHEVVYNCTADAKLHTKISLDAPVEIQLTRALVEAAASCGVSRFIQLSTIVIYDFQSNEPIDESYSSQPEYPIQSLGIEREKIIEEAGRKHGITTIILRPASTIGARDVSSFFARLFMAHANDQYPMIGNGAATVSLVDTRDIGRAMVWLGTYQKPEQDNGIYLLKGFDTTWNQLKTEIDCVAGKISKVIHLPETITDKQLIEYKLTPFAMKTFTVNRLWNDNKIRNLGFHTKYSLTNAVKSAVKDLMVRMATTY